MIDCMKSKWQRWWDSNRRDVMEIRDKFYVAFLLVGFGLQSSTHWSFVFFSLAYLETLFIALVIWRIEKRRRSRIEFKVFIPPMVAVKPPKDLFEALEKSIKVKTSDK